jgi:HEAT repeat protein
MSDNDASELLQIIKNGSSIQRPRALKELQENYGLDYVELYKECLRDRDWHVREQAIFALGKWLGKNIMFYKFRRL